MTGKQPKLGEVATALTASFPSQRSELESFDSGAEMVRIYHADRFFVTAFDGQTIGWMKNGEKRLHFSPPRLNAISPAPLSPTCH